LYCIAGLFVGAAVDILINVVAVGFQQQFFPNQITSQTLWIFSGLIVLGLLVGYWLGGPIQIPGSTAKQHAAFSLHSLSPERSETFTITRLRALLSYSRLKGKGIHLSDILLIGSRIDIEV